jgi:hypothetical protein
LFALAKRWAVRTRVRIRICVIVFVRITAPVVAGIIGFVVCIGATIAYRVHTWLSLEPIAAAAPSAAAKTKATEVVSLVLLAGRSAQLVRKLD